MNKDVYLNLRISTALRTAYRKYCKAFNWIVSDRLRTLMKEDMKSHGSLITVDDDNYS